MTYSISDLIAIGDLIAVFFLVSNGTFTLLLFAKGINAATSKAALGRLWLLLALLIALVLLLLRAVFGFDQALPGWWNLGLVWAAGGIGLAIGAAWAHVFATKLESRTP